MKPKLPTVVGLSLMFLITGLSSLCPGDGLPLVQTVHDDFVGSGNCATCHSSLQDASGQDVSIDTHWRSTMMANAAKDPLWQAKVSSEVQRNPALQAVIEEKCATCHMPMAKTQAKVLGTPVRILGEDGFLNENHPLHALAMDGVSCAACHQISSMKFPSGFPSRRTWIHVSVTDGFGESVFESGRPDELGRIEGNDADFVPGGCEPHYRVVSSPQEVQIYESVMENTDGEVTYTLLRGAAYRKDNRLLPKGFEIASADPRIAVFGMASSDPDFTAGQDKVSYQVATGARPGPYLVDVKLYYQSVSAAFATDLREDSTDEVVRYILMHDSADHTPVTVASMRFSLDPSEFYHLTLDSFSQENGPSLTISGPVGGSVDLEMSDDLSNWSLLETLQPPTFPFTYEDTGASGVPKRFYRLSWPLDLSAE